MTKTRSTLGDSSQADEMCKLQDGFSLLQLKVAGVPENFETSSGITEVSRGIV